MNSGELLPVVSGLVLGLMLVKVPAALRNRVGVAAALLLGGLISTITGELQISYAYLAFDVALVSISAVIGYVGIARLRHRAID